MKRKNYFLTVIILGVLTISSYYNWYMTNDYDIMFVNETIEALAQDEYEDGIPVSDCLKGTVKQDDSKMEWYTVCDTRTGSKIYKCPSPIRGWIFNNNGTSKCIR